MARQVRMRTGRKNRRLRNRKAGGFRFWVGRVGWRSLSLAVLASLTLLGFTLYQYFQRCEGLNVGEIKIMGCMNATESELLHLAKVDFRASLINLDLREVSSRLAKHPWVEKAKVKRDWSGKALIIEVQERVPQALILLEDLYLVDRQGEVFKRVESKDKIDYPVLTGLEFQEIKGRDKHAMAMLRQALDLLELLAQRKIFTPREVSEIHIHRQNGLTIYSLKEAIPIRLGWGELENKISRLEKVLPDLRPKIKDVQYLDLNYPRKVVVKMKEAEKGKPKES